MLIKSLLWLWAFPFALYWDGGVLNPIGKIGSVFYKEVWEIVIENAYPIAREMSRSLINKRDLIGEEKGFVGETGTSYKRKDYIDLLRDTRYRGPASSDTLCFTYQGPKKAELVKVRKYFNLDSIAGQGDEISRIKNLLAWAHNVVRHDGNSINPEQKNAIDIVKICREEKRGVNCRMLATLLNECYLAMGIPSRFVTCLPLSETDPDCHVINSVYSRTLHKWVWMDPTFNAYVTDENGILLGIAEVRQRLIEGRPLVLNEDANWNNEKKQTVENYLYHYMAKNLYWLQCPLNSCWNAESGKRVPWNYLSLVPKDFKRKVVTSYVTSDPDYFWQEPGRILENE